MLTTNDHATRTTEDSLTGVDLFEVIELDDLLELAQNTVNVCPA